MNIKFHVPLHEKIPTQLRLKVTDENEKIYDVCYYRDPDKFVYSFDFLNFQFEDENGFIYQGTMDRIMDEIIDLFLSQSEDHGSRWVRIGQKITHQDRFGTTYQITFKRRDGT